MELSEEAIHDAIYPTAAFCSRCIRDASHPANVERERDWEESFLNPKNRIDSFEVPRGCLWEMDGCTAFGSQFYATPLFTGPMPPMRMDVFVPEPSKLPLHMREMLEVDVTFHTRDKDRIAHVALTRHIQRILHHWASQMEDPRRIYQGVPFGSRIVLRNMPIDVAAADISIAPAHHLERQLLTVQALNKFWEGGLVHELPPANDVSELTYVSQVHDSVCIVRWQGRELIFKALTSDSKFLYHELRQLHRIPAHPNILARPEHVVTKRCGFGSKRAVLGFTEELHTGGSLRDLVPFLELHHQLPVPTKARWATQLASALVHLRHEAGMYYSDLRLDNVVLKASGDIVMVDFEQRGVWCEFAAPEVNAIEYVRIVAVDSDVEPDVRARYTRILDSMAPGWEATRDGEEYRWPADRDGYNVPWVCLTPTEQEACEVYMLGRLLWCLFESESAPQRPAMWLSYRWEPAAEFPTYTRTPPALRGLIDRCTAGRKSGLGSLIVRERGRLILRHLEGTGTSTADMVQQTAARWWADELGEAEDWLRRRADGLAQGTWNENYYGRPTMREVYAELEAFQKSVSA